MERGKFLSLDLGGTNFRVIVLELTKDAEFVMDTKVYAIPEGIMTGVMFSVLEKIFPRKDFPDIFPIGSEGAGKVFPIFKTRKGKKISFQNLTFRL